MISTISIKIRVGKFGVGVGEEVHGNENRREARKKLAS